MATITLKEFAKRANIPYSTFHYQLRNHPENFPSYSEGFDEEEVEKWLTGNHVTKLILSNDAFDNWFDASKRLCVEILTKIQERADVLDSDAVSDGINDLQLVINGIHSVTRAMISFHTSNQKENNP